jgi:predicted DNA-binding protein (UPF0251 family)
VADPRRFDWLFRPHARDEDAPLSAEARFAEALAQLPADERSALAFSELGGLEPDAIAQRLGTDRQTAERLVAQARAAVRAALAERGRRLLSSLLPLASAARTVGAAAVGTVGIGATVDAGAVIPAGRDAPREAAVAAAAPPHLPAVARPASAPATRPPALRLAAAPPAAVAGDESAGSSRSRGSGVTPAHAAPPAPTAEQAPSAGQVDRTPRLGLVRVGAVARRQVRPHHVGGAVLHLPDVTELVRDEVVRRVRAAKQDRPHERVAVVAAQARQAEEPGGVDDTHAVDPDRLRVEVEGVEPRLRTDDPPVRASAPTPSAG